jgi:hypothetical protein
LYFRRIHVSGDTSTKRKRVSDLRRDTLAGASCLYFRRIRTKVALSDYQIDFIQANEIGADPTTP